jgi:hypothetical protein
VNKLDRQLCVAALAVFLAASGPASAADAAKEVAVAAQHANYAASATVLDTARAHLHHTANCLAGPNGPGFDANSMNPCNGMGNGAIPDTADTGKKKILQDALERANAGLAASGLAEAKAAAQEAASMLKSGM